MGAEQNVPAVAEFEKRLCALIDSTVKALDDETEEIRRCGTRDLEKFIERKGQALVNLDRHLRQAGQISAGRALADQLKILRDAIERNRRHLAINIHAVSEVSRMIVRSIEAAQSDGTYAQPCGGNGDHR